MAKDVPADPMCDPANPREIPFSEIACASYVISGSVIRTPCLRSANLSEMTSCDLYIKREYMQTTGSFKERGARYALSKLSKEAKVSGVICASAGNHALGMSFHGRLLGIPVTVVMPKNAPLVKVNNCRMHKAKTILSGDNLQQSKDYALTLSKEKGICYINGYDHPDVIAGQGTIGLEIVEQVPDVDAVIVQVGGAGLLAGISLAVKTLRPQATIIAVEPERCRSFSHSMNAGKPVEVNLKPTLADGLAVSMVGYNAFKIASKCVDKIVCVSETVIATAILKLVEVEKVVVEGAGAAGFAALLTKTLPELQGKKVVIVLSGGNIDTTVLCHTLRRGLALEGRLIRFTLILDDRLGVNHLTQLLSKRNATIRDVHIEKVWTPTDVHCEQARVVVETRDGDHASEVEDALRSVYPDLSCDRLSKGEN
ncbi:PALP domain containing protein [Trichuris trichiura]|uniref:L-serine deaminase n=1 Tax=Trichuris trichiura TaxID=36087 RepID=A0A077Z955_TRITR|nr:PALP domain containing protein [Trichuris trichiura]